MVYKEIEQFDGSLTTYFYRKDGKTVATVTSNEKGKEIDYHVDDLTKEEKEEIEKY